MPNENRMSRKTIKYMETNYSSLVEGHSNKTPFSQVMEDFEFRKIGIHSL